MMWNCINGFLVMLTAIALLASMATPEELILYFLRNVGNSDLGSSF